jgi:hypothetical protein
LAEQTKRGDNNSPERAGVWKMASVEDTQEKPLLFKYATKELAQDAFFCWLLEWSEEKYKDFDLYKISKSFLKHIIGKDIVVKKMEILIQEDDIDFRTVINNEIAILFEDKVRSENHGKQLEKYKKIMKKKHPQLKHFFVYLKTYLLMGKEREEVNNSEYKIIDIKILKKILSPDIKNEIYRDFYKAKIKSLLNFESTKKENWGRTEWDGFILKLSENIKYLPERTGNYMSKFWFILDWEENFDKNVDVSLEIETGNFAVKFHFPNYKKDKEYAKNIIDKYKEKIYSLFSGFKTSNKNLRLGRNTTLLRFEDFRKFNEKGCLDFKATKCYIEKIRKIFLDSITKVKKN